MHKTSIKYVPERLSATCSAVFCMKLLLFNPGCRAGALTEDSKIVDLHAAYARYLNNVKGETRPYESAGAILPSSLDGIIRGGERSLKEAQEVVRFALDNRQLTGLKGEQILYDSANVEILAPLPSHSAKIICFGGNFPSHTARARGIPVEEARKVMLETKPWGFIKLNQCVVGPTDSIVHPARTKELDYEIEVAAIIGRQGKDIPVDSVDKYIFGYTALIDYSLRDAQEPQMPLTVALGKNFDTSAVLGPYIVPRHDMINPNSLRTSLKVNGQIRQDGNTSEMVKGFPEIIAWYSRDLTFYPGDIVTCGTCGGTAMEKRNAEKDSSWFLKPGDVVEAEVEGIGVIRNNIVSK